MTKPTKFALAAFCLLLAGSFMVVILNPPDMPRGKSATRIYQPTAAAVQTSSGGTPSDLPILDFTLPKFSGITRWWNTPDGRPLTPEELKGKVVLVDFWTYSCINCIRTYPFLKSLHEKYAGKGVVIVGVHTPEFAFEADADNVGREISKNGIEYPVALDPDYATWNAYQNNTWPAEYLFDQEGRLRHVHLGEGEYDRTEGAIRSLLAETPGIQLGQMGTGVTTPDFSKIRTPETYFGLARGQAFLGETGGRGAETALSAATEVPANRWTAGGVWRWQTEYVQADSAGAIFRFNVQAKKLHIVMESADGNDKALEVFVDGKKTKTLDISASDLYDIAEFPDAGRHTVEIRILDPGVRFYAATFS